MADFSQSPGKKNPSKECAACQWVLLPGPRAPSFPHMISVFSLVTPAKPHNGPLSRHFPPFSLFIVAFHFPLATPSPPTTTTPPPFLLFFFPQGDKRLNLWITPLQKEGITKAAESLQCHERTWPYRLKESFWRCGWFLLPLLLCKYKVYRGGGGGGCRERGLSEIKQQLGGFLRATSESWQAPHRKWPEGPGPWTRRTLVIWSNSSQPAPSASIEARPHIQKRTAWQVFQEQIPVPHFQWRK